jgi:hypothetical protein
VLVTEESTSEETCRCTACINGTEQVNVNYLARYVFLVVQSCKQYFGLSMLSRYLCGVRESTSDCDDYSTLFEGKSLSGMPLFGILKWPHARIDQMTVFIHKLFAAGYLDQHTVFLPELPVRKERLAYCLNAKSLDALANPNLSVYITVIRSV